ncbi:MAG: S8 family serine peptidase, partial [Gammaproteobacteria bacterium]|nr:S8 family serine peptidase [Gammaproteobacteria bacterium]
LLAGCGGGGGGAAPPALLSIKVAPANPTLKLGRSLQMTATGYYSYGAPKDITASVTWSASAPTGAFAATVNTTGLVTVTAGNPGNSITITATSGAINNASTITLIPKAFTVAASATVGSGDPLSTQQWHLKNTGQNAFADTGGVTSKDINAEPVYNNTAPADACGTGVGCTGYGVKVAVVDTGLEIAHEDLAANVIPNGSWNFNNNSTDPTNTATTGDHGTSVAGLIASQAYNGKGGMGVAPEASLKGFNFLDSAQGIARFVDSIGGSTSSPNSSDVAIFNQSFGGGPTKPYVESSTIVNQYAYGVSTLRGGLGALYVKAAGNGFYDMGITNNTNCLAAIALGITCENANFDPDNVLPYNIVVGSINANGVKSSYSTTGSALWVSAPGGEFGANESKLPGYSAVVYEPAMITTDQSGCAAGFSQTTGAISTFDAGANALNSACNYTNTMNGTSSATPVTSGVIALMLEANPNLSWRDVKHILASTPTIKPAQAAITVALTTGGNHIAEAGWTAKTVGYDYHNWYGFGVVNASAAVAMAKTTCSAGCGLGTFTAYPSTTTLVSSGTLNAVIPDSNAAGVISPNLSIGSTLSFVEAVQIQVTIKHSYWGDLGIELTSPSGTKSILKNIRDGFKYNTGTTAGSMLLESNAFYGEPANGNWKLTVVDGNDSTTTYPSTNTTGGTLVS